ncbi:MAG: hypothetical protein RL223_1091 [Pseudomonadota bacterium]|jgi:hypothetical protein
MPIRYLKKHAALEGRIAAEDAEGLQQWLRAQARPAVALDKCEQVHAAVLQVLLALRPALQGRPTDPWLAAALGLR